MEGDDLIVRRVGGDEAGRGELVLDHAQVIAAQPAAVHPVGVGPEIRADRREQDRIDAEPAEVVGDVGARAAVLLRHRRDVKRHVQLLELVADEVAVLVIDLFKVINI